MSGPHDRLVLGGSAVDLNRGEVHRDGRVTPLTAIELRLLRRLAERPGEPVATAVLLREVWGYRDGVRTGTAKTTVRRLREKIEPDPSHPRHLLSVPSLGYRLEVDPDESPDLVGRGAALADLRRRFAPWVSVVGPGGVGKTTLARAWALGAGALEVPLAATRTRGEVRAALFGALGLRAEPDPGAAILAVRGAPAVVFLDNLEQLDESGLAEVAALVRPGLRVVATSRRPLAVPGEEVMSLEPLEPAAAARLFRLRVEAARPGWADGDPTRLLTTLDRLPLAIELAAARLGLTRLEDLERRLAACRDGGAPSPLASLHVVVRASHDLLSDDGRAALAALSVCRGFDLDAAEQLLDDPGAAGRIDDLLRHSLVYRRAGPHGVVFHLYEGVAAFAETVLVGEARERAEERHAAWILGRAPLSAGVPTALTGFELDNLRAAVGRAERRDPARHAELLLALEARVRGDEPHASAHRLALAVSRPLPPALRSALLTLRGDALRQLQAHQAALACLDEAVAAAEDDAGRRAAALVERALTRIEVGDVAGGLEDAVEAVALAEPAGPSRVLARAWINEAAARRYLGEPGCGALYQRAAEAAGAVGDDDSLGLALINHGGVETYALRLDRAVPLLLRGAAVARRAGRVRTEAIALGVLGAAWLDRGDLDEADRTLARAEALLLRCSSARELAPVRLNRAGVALDRGRYREAQVLIAEAVAGLPPDEQHYRRVARTTTGALHQLLGEAVAAVEEYTLAASCDPDPARRLVLQARIAGVTAIDDPDAAAATLTTIERELAPVGSPAHRWEVRVHGAFVHLARGDRAAAEAVCAAARRRQEDVPGPSPAAWSVDVRLALRLVRRLLDGDGGPGS